MKFIQSFLINNPSFTVGLFLLLLFTGLIFSPFKASWLPDDLRNPVAVDAIPDLGENQQIIFTTWQGRSPKDVEDQITYPLASQLMGIAGVKNIRSFSFLGISSIYLIFDEKI